MQKFEITKLRIDFHKPWMIICPDGMIYFEASHYHCVLRMNLVAGAIGWNRVVETVGEREIAKKYLNSLYGKFASNPNDRLMQ